MGTFSSRSTLYRTARLLVTWAALASILTAVATAQASRAAKKNKGPRALGLLELGPKDKARLIPIEILLDGEYYDGSAYKASPVPLALWSGTVYEGFRAGVSQGLFTVTGALENPETREWLGEGSWLTADMVAKRTKKKPAPSEPRGLDDDSGPPVLRRAAAEPKAPETPPTPPVPPAPAQPPPAAPAARAPVLPTPATPPDASQASATAPPEDPDRPTLKRGMPAPKQPEPFPPPTASSQQPAAKPHSPSTTAKAASMQLIPAISDADGPEPQSYKYEMKAEEESQLRTKALALAAAEVRTWAKQLSGSKTPPATSARPGPRAKSAANRQPQPAFDEVDFRAFDLSSSNEPIVVLTAAMRLPPDPKEKSEPPSQTEFLVALVAREDINGDFHKVFSNVTDNDHLDVLPRMEFIDAVDADGDGRGELLFRQVSDAGSAFVVYRVIGNQLWTLFQGTPGT
ncbi:MAG: hypothetical protein WB952_04365 [Terriglobales bacterium]